MSTSPTPSSSRLLEATRPAFDRLKKRAFIDRRPSSSSLSSNSDSDSISVDSTSSLSSIDKEWEENIRQLHLLIDVILLPSVGKWLGRKTASWLYARYTQHFASQNIITNSLAIIHQITGRRLHK
ncbi:hypothetical protein MJO28_005112 [Puccinia striiformis f. sp. tritici]|nr:hypothetical protein Pst134EB_010360 [Puccinia striiformis f. sp. tritici]KAI7954712.1 hypothetical protein MJO28_005112 [Puccinia striiformis f. sp. tritici]KAI7960104.1 hypothetical protein MJO29_005172 [Puccinia striiformis f. sp. tritici]KAI9609326.1 hypothetical protein H4Q26_007276 [Puccinia striiformis f. sp. tritici PST-130]KNE97029.1 hypothetical protein PSTG_09764 [Puccinia striiformis f. sp. tritici PST-78]